MSPVIQMNKDAPREGRLAQAPQHEAMSYKVVYADTDAMGVVYHGRYLDIAERSRTDFILSAGIDLAKVEELHGIWFMVNRVRADYRRPVRLHETARVTTEVLKLGASQVWWRSQIWVGDQLAANIDVGTACFDTNTNHVCTLPKNLWQRIETLTRSEL